MIFGMKPSDIQSKKLNRLTRRRLMKYLSAAGVSIATVQNITVDDVKAADTDQIPIALDTQGNIIKNVSADWYDRVVHANDVRDKIAANHGDRPSVIGVGYDPASEPNVVIHFHEESESKEKDKGETPNQKDGVTVKKEEVNPKPTACPSEPETCLEYDCRTIEEGKDIPAGTLAEVPYAPGTWGGITSRIRDNNHEHDHGWLISAHQDSSCGDGYRPDVYHQPRDDGGYKIGEIVEVYPNYGAAVVHPTRGISDDIHASPYVADSTNIIDGDRYGPIQATMSKDGVRTWRDNDYSVFRYGPSTCYDDGEVLDIYQDYSVTSDSCGEQTLHESIHITNEVDDGDSGSLAFGYYSPDDIWLGIGILVQEDDRLLTKDRVITGAGYAIHNDLGYHWHE